MKIRNNAQMRKTVRDLIKDKLFLDGLFGDIFEEVNEAVVSLKTDERYHLFEEDCRKKFVGFRYPGSLVMKAAYQFLDETDSRTAQQALIISQNMVRLDPHYLYENAFLKYIQIPEVKIGSYSFKQITYSQYTCLADDQAKEFHTSSIPQFGLLEDELKVPAVEYDGEVILCVAPYEMNGYARDIEKMKGRIMVNGLKLGYFVYMVHLKNEVSHITIVESQQELIDYFYKYLLPQFDHPEKITVIHGNYQDYLADGYDMYYMNNYANQRDGLCTYLAVKPFEIRKKKKVLYYVEKTILDELKIQLMLRIATPELIDISEEDYAKLFAENDLGCADLNAFFDQLKITSPTKLKGLFSRSALKQAINNFFK